MPISSNVYLSLGGFLLRGDVRIQESIDGTAPDLRQIFPARVFRSSFLKCLEQTFADSPILKSFLSSRLIAYIHFSFNMFFFFWEIESRKLLTRLLPDNLS